MSTGSPVSDKSRLLFGAGFVFGVAFTMLILALVTATVSARVGRSLLASEVAVTMAAGIAFAGIVGTSMYFLAFPENRLQVPIPGRSEPATEERPPDERR